jgi:predicted Rossmann fold flavoprotein
VTTPAPITDLDIAIIGAGAAGLMASIFAGRAAHESGHPLRIAAIDGARRLGAKILVAGGGRCNVTHHAVDESAYAGSSRNAIRKVLGRFGVDQTVDFFSELGVELKREETGKLFPTTDDAHTVLNALLSEVRNQGIEILYPWRAASITREGETFVITRRPEPDLQADGSADDRSQSLRSRSRITARRIILATGGLALPKTGSDGAGYSFATSLGHTLTPRIFPALVPLLLPKGHFICELSGLTLPATIELRTGTGKKVIAFTNSTLLTHFGLSGPGILDISRYYTALLPDRLLGSSLPPQSGPDVPRLLLNVVPAFTLDSLDAHIAELGRSGRSSTLLRFLTDHIPDRLARAIAVQAHLDPSTPIASLAKDKRRKLAALLTELELPITGDRGYTYAEVTAGGVPLSEINLATMESRTCPGLHLSGEICDVDGRIGGFNFQWAWASGHIAGTSAACAAVSVHSGP